MPRLRRQVRSVQATLKPQLIRQLKAKKAKLLHYYNTELEKQVRERTVEQRAVITSLNAALLQLQQQLQQAQTELDEYQRASDALRESEPRFRSLIQTAGSVIICLSLSYEIVEWNLQAECIYGWKREEVIGKNYVELFLPETVRATVIANINKVLAGEPPKDFENVILSRDGRKRILNCNITRLMNTEGVPSGVIVIGQEIPACKAAEREIYFQSRLLDAVGQAVIATNLDGTIIYWNRYAETLYGWLAAEVLGQNIINITPAQVSKEQAFEIMSRLQLGESWSGEFLIQRRDGSCFPVMVNNAPIHDAEEKFIGILGISAEITERKLAEEALAASEAKFRSLIQNSSDIITILDRDGVIQYESDSIEKILGYKPKDLIGQNCFDLIHLEDVSNIIKIFHEFIENPGMTLTVEYRWRHQDGSWCALESTASNLLTNPFVAGIVVNSRDITERKAAEAALKQANENLEIRVEKRTAALREANNQLRQEIMERQQAESALCRSEQQLSDFFENATVSLHWVGANGNILRVNQAELNLLGYTREEYLGHHISEFHADPEVINDILERLSRNETLHNYQAQLRCKDGSIKYVLIDSNVLWEDGKFIHARCFSRDITEHKLLEDTLRESEERFRCLSACSPVGIFLTDIYGNCTYTNPCYQAICGCTFEESLAQGWLHFVHPEERDRVFSDWLAYTREGREYASEFRLLVGEGIVRWVHVRSSPMFSDQDELIGHVGTVEDISESLRQTTLRKLAEAELHRREQEFKALAENSPDIIARFDREFRHIYINSAVERSVGISPQTIIGQKPSELELPPETSTYFQQSLQHVLDTKEEWIIEWNSPIQYGSKYYQSRLVPEFNRDSSVESVLAVSRDITTQKQTEQALRDALQRLNFHVENSPLAVIEWDSNFRVSRWSPEAEKVFGWHSDEVLGLSPNKWQFIFASDIKAVNSTMARLIDSSEQRNVSRNRNYTKDGSVVYCEWYNSALLDESGKLVSLLSLVLDVTERKKMEEALRESEQRFRTMADTVPAMIWVAEVNGVSTFFNKAWLDFTGRSLEQELNNGWMESIHPDDLYSFIDTYYSAFHDRKQVQAEYRLRRADGNYRWVIDMGIPRNTPDGSFAGYIGSCIDITERKRAEEEIINALNKEKELSELKSRFVSITSHEFRTPLSVILSSAELLEYYGEQWSPEERLQQLHLIQSSVQHMNQLLNDVLTIGKAEAGRLEFNPARLELVEFCRALVAEIQLTDAGHTIVFVSQYPVLMACIDKKLLRQILSNLLSNAIRYSAQGRAIRFELAYHNEEATFQIQDEGCGIPVEDQSRLFEPFHRATNVTNITGTGLGLTIVKRCVDLHQGRIMLASQVGVGTTFRVCLPLHNQLRS
ncbi:PAS domain S-box protein [Funiculus sociatus]|uniref:PAS domain S-box protein n=1 Tax=Funiculus sociatus TaxID=450527 RepID=UPI003297F8D4